MATTRSRRFLVGLAAAWAAIFFLGASIRVLADCAGFGLPFTDLDSTSFCAEIAEAYYTGITHGTSATTFSPSANVTRDQAAALATRTLDASLTRGSRRAALGQWWTTTPHYDAGLGLTSVGTGPQHLKSDGADIWIANYGDGSVSRVRASDGKLLETWTGATAAYDVLIAMGRVFITGSTAPGSVYMIDPTQSAAAVTLLPNNVGDYPQGIAFDGKRIWTANSSGSVSIVTPGTWDVVNITTGFTSPVGLVFDSSSMWVTDAKTGTTAGTLDRLNSGGGIQQAITVGNLPEFPAFDGQNIWVPNFKDDSLTIVRASDGNIVKTLTSTEMNALNLPIQAAFDGQRILVVNHGGGLSLFKASDLSVITLFGVGTQGVAIPNGACSDGLNFWVSFSLPSTIGRF